MKLKNLIILSTSLFLFSCQKPVKDPDICEAQVRIHAWHDSTTLFDVKVYDNRENYYAQQNPVDEYKGVKSGDVIKTTTRRNTRLYYDVYSDDFSTTNWALHHVNYVNVTANTTSDFLTIATNASYKRMLLPDNTTQSRWIMVGYLDKYGNNIYHTIPDYMKHRSLVINRNRKATYRYLTSPRDTVSEDFVFVVFNEHWKGITNSFSMTFYDTGMVGETYSLNGTQGKMYFADGPISDKHPYYANYNQPHTPAMLIPETDVLLFINEERDSAGILFKRLF